MTFTELQTKVKDYCWLSSTEANTRVGKSLNAVYRRITSTLGLEASRFVTRSVSMTIGVRTATFTSIEKIDRILDTTTSTAIRLLTETSVHEIRSTQPGNGQPDRWALQNTAPDSATVVFDTIPQTAYSLQADGWTSLSDLSGTDEPAFPESFHDILAFLVISEELLKKEKPKLAEEYERRAERLLSELRFYLADSPTRETQQGSSTASASSGSSSGGGGTQGGTSYTQSGLLTFDRGAGITPFAVAEADAPYVANLGAEFLGNVTTDRLIGRDTAGTGESEQLTVGGGVEFSGSGGIQRSALTGAVTASAGSGATAIAADAVTTVKILDANVTTAKLADDAVTYAKIQNISATSRILGRKTAAAGDTEECTLSQVLDFIGSAAQGDILYRDSAAWARLGAGTSGQYLKTLGAAANPLWAASTMSLLKAGSGTSSSTSATNVDTIAISGLTANDTLVIYYDLDEVTQALSDMILQNSTDAVTVAGLTGGAGVAAGAGASGTVRIRQSQSANTAINAVANGASTASAAITYGARATFTTAWTGSWTLAFRSSGVTSGGTLKWSWAVYKVAGQ